MAGQPQTLPRPVRLAGTVALAVVAGLAIALVVDVARDGGPARWLAGRGMSPPYQGQGGLVDIGGRSLYLDCRGSGTPTVVLESGMGDGVGAWTLVHDELAASTRTCAYDRAGRGTSDPRGRHTLADAAADLRTVLDTAGERGPFVVVGHSLGGDYARIFASDHRDEVAGVALVDSFNPDLEAAAIHPLLGDLRGEYEARLQSLRDLVAGIEDLDWVTSEQQLTRSSLTGLPLEVLRAPRGEPRLDEDANAAIALATREAYEGMSPGHVRYELAWGAGHVIQGDRPDLVIEAVRRLVDHARAQSG